MKKIISFTLLLVLLTVSITAVGDEMSEIFFYDNYTDPGYYSPINAYDNDVAGYFSFDEGVLTMLTIRTGPTWSASEPSSVIKVLFYEWQGSYEQTIKSEPVAECIDRNHGDNDPYYIEPSAELPAGEYLWRFTEVAADNHAVGIWLDSECEGIDSYINGILSEYDFHISITVENRSEFTRPEDTYTGTTILPYIPPENDAATPPHQIKLNLISYLSGGGEFYPETVTIVFVIIGAMFAAVGVSLLIIAKRETKKD